MRIIAGDRRGAKLASGRASGYRPTSDRVREAIFAILGDRVEGARVVDLFAGSGALGLEALSRGAAEAILVEKRRAVAAWAERNAANLRFTGRCRVIRADAVRIARLGTLLADRDLLFADPPYGKGLAAPLVEALHALPGERLLVLERERREEHGIELTEWTARRRYGDTVVEFLNIGKEASR